MLLPSLELQAGLLVPLPVLLCPLGLLPALPVLWLWLKHAAGGPDTQVGSSACRTNSHRGADVDCRANDTPLKAGRRPAAPTAARRVTGLRGASRTRLRAIPARPGHTLPLMKPSVCSAGCPPAVTLGEGPALTWWEEEAESQLGSPSRQGRVACPSTPGAGDALE